MDVTDPKYALAVDHVNKIAVKAFEKGLNDHIRRSLVFQSPSTLKEIYELAQKFEDKEKCVSNNEDKLITQKLMSLLKMNKEPGHSGFKNPQINHTVHVLCQICGNSNHTAIDCPRNLQVNHTVSNNCQICGIANHTARECPRNSQNVVCQLCNYQGHTAIQCRPYGGQQQRGFNNNRTRSSNWQGGYFGRQGNDNSNRTGYNQQNRNSRGGFSYNQNNGYKNYNQSGRNSNQ